jgi:hypothetical protein
MGTPRANWRRVALVLGVAVGGSLYAAQAASANTVIGPGPAVASNDYETCGNTWANTTQIPKFIVSPENFDGSYNVTVQLSIKFTSLAGQSPGACAPDTTGGSTILANVKGGGTGQYKFYVTGGTFNPSATCDTTCFSQGSFGNEGPFTTAFFGPDATWTAAVPDILGIWHYSSGNSVLVQNSYTASWPNGTFYVGVPLFPVSASGDIATG